MYMEIYYGCVSVCVILLKVLSFVFFVCTERKIKKKKKLQEEQEEEENLHIRLVERVLPVGVSLFPFTRGHSRVSSKKYESKPHTCIYINQFIVLWN